MMFFFPFAKFFFHAHLLSTGLDDVLSRLEQVEQSSSRAVPRLGDTSDTSGDESDMGEPRRRLWSKWTHKVKKAWGVSDVGQFFVTGPTDVATKPSHFHCRICREDVSVLTHDHHRSLPHFQSSKHFPRDQRLRLDTPSWGVLDFEGNVMSPANVERQREKIMRDHLAVRDRECPFPEDVLSTRLVQWTRPLELCLRFLPSLKCCVWAEIMNWWTSYGLSLLCLLSESTWMLRGYATRSRLVFLFVPYCLPSLCAFSLFSLLPILVHHSQWDVSSYFV